MESEPARTPQPATPSHDVVTAGQVLRALSEVRRRGHWTLLQELESAQPELANFVLEELSSVHHVLLDSRARPKVVRRLQRRVQALVLVCLLAPQQEASPPGGRDSDFPTPPPADEPPSPHGQP